MLPPCTSPDLTIIDNWRRRELHLSTYQSLHLLLTALKNNKTTEQTHVEIYTDKRKVLSKT